MAIIIPRIVNEDDFHSSLGEKRIYESLKSLPDDYIVFHSVSWQQKSKNGRVSWGEADFTIFHPKRGLIVLEVKSGGIQLEEGNWVQINTLTKERYKMKDPLIQANRSKYTFIDLINHNKNCNISYPIEVAVAFPSISKNDIPFPLPPAYSIDTIISNSDLNNMKSAIERIFNYYNMYEKPYFTDSDKNICIQLLSPEFNSIPNMKQQFSEEAYVFNRLTKEQSILLDYLEEQRSAAIQGRAGTGKTILAVEKAIRLSKDEKVLFLCFNKFLLDHLKSIYSKENPNIDFYNLPALTQSKTNSHEAWTNESIIRFLNSYDDFQWDYKHIVIDEGQDFLAEQIELLKTIADVNNGNIYVFYDRDQIVHKHSSDTLNWLNYFDCRLILTINCRNTKNIAITSYRQIGVSEVKTKETVIGIKPNFFIERSIDKAIERIAYVITKYVESGLSKNQITIITAKTEDSSLLSGLNKIGSHKLKSKFEDNGILFTSSRKFKGLETSVVIVVDVNDVTFSNDEYNRVLYVATSRAQHCLDIICIADDKKINSISEILTGKASKSPKLDISKELKVKVHDKQ